MEIPGDQLITVALVEMDGIVYYTNWLPGNGTMRLVWFNNNTSQWGMRTHATVARREDLLDIINEIHATNNSMAFGLQTHQERNLMALGINTITNRVREAITPQAIPQAEVQPKRGISRKKMTVAEAVAHFSFEKRKQLADQAKREEEHIQSKTIQLREMQKQLRVQELKVQRMNKKVAAMPKTKKALTLQYKEIEQRLIANEYISDLSVDREKRIVVTTVALSIQKDYWPGPQIAGKYQIRIDFSQPDVSSGVLIVNTERRYDAYDSPTISNGRCCWGNVKEDVVQDFQLQDVYELVVDLIDYIRSPHDEHGYLRGDDEVAALYPGHDDKLGWEQFFHHAEDKKFSVALWDKQNASQYSTEPQPMTYNPGQFTTSDIRFSSNLGTATAMTTGYPSQAVQIPEEHYRQMQQERDMLHARIRDMENQMMGQREAQYRGMDQNSFRQEYPSAPGQPTYQHTVTAGSTVSPGGAVPSNFFPHLTANSEGTSLSETNLSSALGSIYGGGGNGNNQSSNGGGGGNHFAGLETLVANGENTVQAMGALTQAMPNSASVNVEPGSLPREQTEEQALELVHSLRAMAEDQIHAAAAENNADVVGPISATEAALRRENT